MRRRTWRGTFRRPGRRPTPRSSRWTAPRAEAAGRRGRGGRCSRRPRPHTSGTGRGPVDRVVRIQELYAAGPHSERIRQLLPCVRDQDGGPSAVATARLVAGLASERERIDRMIADLVRSRDTLDEVIEAAQEH
ncbi:MULTISPECIES: MerR family transcriptional regulator [unclassified Streptomyces]|uniref:MerR family transcriptional regulator n=1 Tax=unclassified Streptomyces TaxID=2593676 RepID=UPI003868C98E